VDEWKRALMSLRSQGVRVSRLTADSRKAAPGIVFAAYPGERMDGRAFIDQAVRAGAAAVLWEARDFAWPQTHRIPNAPVADLKQHIGEIASEVLGRPSERLRVFGVTGTNGKTSVSQWLAQCASLAGGTAAVIGTIGNGVFGALEASANTTPDAIELQEMLARFAEGGVRSLAMEVSSHGLHQGRVNGVRFEVAVFTNLSRDHLDYHRDMASYAAAKYRLFEMPGLKSAVLNIDDPIGVEFARKLAGSNVNIIGYGLEMRAEFEFPVLRASDLKLGQDGVELDVAGPWGSGVLRAPVVGRFNASNLLAVLGTLLASGVEMNDALKRIASITPVAGRLQKLGGGGTPLVLVDYAHSPDGLEKALQAARDLVLSGRGLWCVFGCGGDRDRGKRPLMGAIAERLADRIIVTSDNPRGEAPQAIVAEIAAGMKTPPTIIVDRAQAIGAAIREAVPGDVILVAGKGHEDYQEIQGQRFPFSDAETARQALAARSAP
jgi:UDP-N-acetylmuramoyl-L-alanyl-D-glutamate--2,6-diaminopimelate ligase